MTRRATRARCQRARNGPRFAHAARDRPPRSRAAGPPAGRRSRRPGHELPRPPAPGPGRRGGHAAARLPRHHRDRADARDVVEGLGRYYESACANCHTHVNRAGKATTDAIEDTRDVVGELVRLRPRRATSCCSRATARPGPSTSWRARCSPPSSACRSSASTTSARPALAGARA